MTQPLPDTFGFSDALMLSQAEQLARVLMIMLGLILAQTVVFFLAICLTGCAGNRDNKPRRHIASPDAVPQSDPGSASTFSPALIQARPSEAPSAVVPIFSQTTRRHHELADNLRYE